MRTSVELWGLLAHTTRTFVTPLLHCNGKKHKSPDGAAARKMLSEGWTAEPTGCDRVFPQSSHLLRRMFQIPLLFQTLNSSWAHQGQPVEWRHDLNSVHMPGLLLLFIALAAVFAASYAFEPTVCFTVRAQPPNRLHPEWFSLVLSGSLLASWVTLAKLFFSTPAKKVKCKKTRNTPNYRTGAAGTHTTTQRTVKRVGRQTGELKYSICHFKCTCAQ